MNPAAGKWSTAPINWLRRQLLKKWFQNYSQHRRHCRNTKQCAHPHTHTLFLYSGKFIEKKQKIWVSSLHTSSPTVFLTLNLTFLFPPKPELSSSQVRAAFLTGTLSAASPFFLSHSLPSFLPPSFLFSFFLLHFS